MIKRYLLFAIALFMFGVSILYMHFIKKNISNPFIGFISIAFSFNYLFLFFANKIKNYYLKLLIKTFTFIIPLALLLYYFFIYKNLKFSELLDCFI